MSRPAAGYGSGAEQVARAAALQIAQNLEDQCHLQEVIWNDRDQDWAAAMEIAYVPTRITRVAKSSIYLGAQPSLVAGIESRFDKWPAVTVRCATRTPSNVLEQADQYDSLDLSLTVEVLAMAGPFVADPLDDHSSSDAIDRQYQRLSDAVIACINLDRGLGGNILPLKLPPIGLPSLPFVRKEDAGSGRWLVFQGIELTWIATSLLH